MRIENEIYKKEFHESSGRHLSESLSDLTKVEKGPSSEWSCLSVCLPGVLLPLNFANNFTAENKNNKIEWKWLVKAYHSSFQGQSPKKKKKIFFLRNQSLRETSRWASKLLY